MLEIKTLPFGMGGFLPLPNVPPIYTDDRDNVRNTTYINTQFYHPSPTQRGKEMVHLKPREVYFCKNVSGEFTLALKQTSTKSPKCVIIHIEQQKKLRGQHVPQAVQVKEEPPDSPPLPVISKIESLNSNTDKQVATTLSNQPTCPECHEPQRRPMTDHFLGHNVPNEIYSCKDCKFIASTACSLSAHKRIHDFGSPFVCPECGKCFVDFNDLRLHMDDVCFHLVKNIRYRCPGRNCGKLFAMQQTYAAHFEVHMQTMLICSVCKAGFHSEEDFKKHEKAHSESCHLMKGSMCTVCTNPKLTFNEVAHKQHILWHTKDRKRCMYVYMCKNCRSYFRSTTTYITHLMKCTKTGSVPLRLSKGVEIIKYVNNNCMLCNVVIVSREISANALCIKCKNLKFNTMRCSKCNENITYHEANVKPRCTKCNHINLIESKKFACLLCNKMILKEEQAAHKRYCKYGEPVVMMPRVKIEPSVEMALSTSSDETSRDSETKRKSESPEESSRKKRKRMSVTKSKKPNVNGDGEKELQAEKPIVFNGVYRCRLCYHKEERRDAFHKHILKHRDIQTSYQCMECGECFVVKPSLTKHLVHYHNIMDPEEYLQQNNCYDHKAVKQLSEVLKLAPGESKDVKENQCCVCREEFPNKTVLNQHFRIHGMAFLRMKMT